MVERHEVIFSDLTKRKPHAIINTTCNSTNFILPLNTGQRFSNPHTAYFPLWFFLSFTVKGDFTAWKAHRWLGRDPANLSKDGTSVRTFASLAQDTKLWNRSKHICSRVCVFICWARTSVIHLGCIAESIMVGRYLNPMKHEQYICMKCIINAYGLQKPANVFSCIIATSRLKSSVWA